MATTPSAAAPNGVSAAVPAKATAAASSPLPLAVVAAAPAPPRVTVLSGFLGSGKTTLLRHLLTAAPAGKRVAVVVNDMAEINIDAALIRRVTPAPAPASADGSGSTLVAATAAAAAGAGPVAPPPTIVELQNGCICCTLRDDLVTHLASLARAVPPFDAILVESTGVAEPRPVAESFQFEVDPELAADAATGSGSAGTPADDGALGVASPPLPRRRRRDEPQVALNDIAPLDTMVTVVDVSVFGEMLATTDAPVDRWGPSGAAVATVAAADNSTAPGHAAALATTATAAPDAAVAATAEAEEYRPLSQLLVEQVEYANVIILNKTDLVSGAATAAVRAQVGALNRGAVVVEASHGRVPFGAVVATHAFDDTTVRSGAGWLVEMRAGGSDAATASSAVPSVDAGAVANDSSAGGGAATVRSELDEYNLSSFVYRRRRPFHPIRLAAALDTLCGLGQAVLRAKGFVWVASRHDTFGELSKAGATWSLGRGGTWLVTDPYFQTLAARRFGALVPPHVAATAGPDASLSATEGAGRAAVTPLESGATMAAVAANEAPASTGENVVVKADGSPAAADKREGLPAVADNDEMSAAAGKGERTPAAAEGEQEENDGEGEDEFAAAALGDFTPTLGDRRQEVVLIGRGMARPAVERVLDAALLTDHEYAVGSRQWALLPDGLDSWSDGGDDGISSGSEDDSNDSGFEADEGAAATAAAGPVVEDGGCTDAGCTTRHGHCKRSLQDEGAGGAEVSHAKKSKP